MKTIFKKVGTATIKRVDEGIRPSLRGKYAEMMKDIYTIYAAYAADEGVRPESEGAVRQMIFDQAMGQFESHDPVIRLPVGPKAECEMDMNDFSAEQLAEIAQKIRTGNLSEPGVPAEEKDGEAIANSQAEDELGTDEMDSDSKSVFGDLRG